MKYKGIYLLDTSGTPRTITPPRDMLVWDDNPSRMAKEPCIRKVLAIVDSKLPNGKVICETESMFVRYGHCADIPEELKSRRATNRELAKWLSHGLGQMHYADGSNTYTFYKYYRDDDATTVTNNITIRKWDDSEWHAPTIDYMGIKE